MRNENTPWLGWSSFRIPRSELRTNMSYQVIARKYRPQRFQDVVGQEHVTQTLAHAIEQNRIAHAYLFCGPRGTGKTTIARIFAKCLNCAGGPKVDFDDDDPRCQEIAEGRSLDVLEIDGASNNGVEQVRELRETCKLRAGQLASSRSTSSTKSTCSRRRRSTRCSRRSKSRRRM